MSAVGSEGQHLKKAEEPTYLILSVRSPMKMLLHKILSDIPAERLLLVTDSKSFSEKEEKELSPFFNTILRVKNYRDSGNLELEVYKLYQKYPFQKVIAYHEYDLLRAARLRDFFNLKGQDYQSALAFRDKVQMKNLLLKADIKVPPFMRIHSPSDILEFTRTQGFPVVVKPVFGTGADGVCVLNNLKEAEEFISNYQEFSDYPLTDLEVEGFIKGTTYHVDGFIQNGKIIASWPSVCIHHCVDLSQGSYVAHHHLALQNPMVKRLNQYAASVLQALPTPNDTAFLLEVFHRESDDAIIFCEIAARVGGGVKEMWPEAFGVDLENEFIRTQADLKPSTSLTHFLEPSSHLPAVVRAISGWIIFPKPLDALRFIPETTPFPWVKEYIVRVQPKQLNLPSRNISDSLASAFMVAGSEEEFRERVVLLNAWLQQESQWEKASVSLATVKCIKSCEESIKQVEKIDCEQVRKFIKAQEEHIDRQKNAYSPVSSTSSQATLTLPLLHTSSFQSSSSPIFTEESKPLSQVGKAPSSLLGKVKILVSYPIKAQKKKENVEKRLRVDLKPESPLALSPSQAFVPAHLLLPPTKSALTLLRELIDDIERLPVVSGHCDFPP